MNCSIPIRARRIAALVAALLVGLSFLTGSAGCVAYTPHPLAPGELLRELNQVQISDALAMAPAEDESMQGLQKIVIADGIGPAEAAWAAVALNPDLREHLALRGMVAGELLEAKLWPNPTLGMEFRQALQSNGKSLELSLAMEVLRWEERSAIRAQAEARQTAALYAVRAQADAVALSARQRWWQAVAARERMKLNAQELTLAEKLLAHLRVKQKAGAATALEVNIAALEKIQIELDRLRLQEEQTAADRDLRQVIGLPPTAELPLQISAQPFAAGAALPVYDDALPLLLNSPKQKSAEADYLAVEGELRAAISRQYPSLQLGPAASWEFDGSWSTLLGAVVSVDLPIWNRNQGEIAGKTAARDRLRAAYTAQLHRHRADLAGACGAAAASRQKLEFIDREVLPSAREFLRLTEAAFAAGNVDVLEIFKAQSVATTVNRQVLEAQIADRFLAEAVYSVLGQPFFVDTPATVDPIGNFIPLRQRAANAPSPPTDANAPDDLTELFSLPANIDHP